jgi:PIN domain nuclease of toxin-antitoxin system
MKLLLDTHAFPRFIDNNPRLSVEAKALLESDVELLISIVSLWENAIKVNLGKLALSQPYDTFIPQQLKQNMIAILPIDLAHLAVLSASPFYHRDPFDRLLIAQAIVEHLPLVSADAAFDAYAVERRWQ